MTAPTRRPLAVWLAGCLAGSVALLSGCDPSSQTPSENTTASTGDVRVSEVWRVENLPRTASVFLRSGRVVAAGEVEDGADDVLVVLDEATGALEWQHSLRSPTDDPDAVPLVSERIQIVSATDGVYLSTFSLSNQADPILGYALNTGKRLFPPVHDEDEWRVQESFVGATTGGLVTDVGIIRDPVSGLPTRVKTVPGSVVAVAGTVGFSWRITDPVLTGYDITTDEELWNIQIDERPDVIVLDPGHVVVADQTSWRLVDVATGDATPLPGAGGPNTFGTVSACAGNEFQVVPVSRSTPPVSCDGRFVGFIERGRLEILDTQTAQVADIAVCNPTTLPFTVQDGLVLCASGSESSSLALRILDAATGFQIARFEDPNLLGATGMAFLGSRLVLTFADGTFVGYDVTRI
ncbi:MAG: PQQ-binding-like beta-propeller repeat protein [Ilumatobacteraceae bacterium]